jgi:hypothetical protein
MIYSVELLCNTYITIHNYPYKKTTVQLCNTFENCVAQPDNRSFSWILHLATTSETISTILAMLLFVGDSDAIVTVPIASATVTTCSIAEIDICQQPC